MRFKHTAAIVGAVALMAFSGCNSFRIAGPCKSLTHHADGNCRTLMLQDSCVGWVRNSLGGCGDCSQNCGCAPVPDNIPTLRVPGIGPGMFCSTGNCGGGLFGGLGCDGGCGDCGDCGQGQYVGYGNAGCGCEGQNNCGCGTNCGCAQGNGDCGCGGSYGGGVSASFGDDCGGCNDGGFAGGYMGGGVACGGCADGSCGTNCGGLGLGLGLGGRLAGGLGGGFAGGGFAHGALSHGGMGCGQMGCGQGGHLCLSCRSRGLGHGGHGVLGGHPWGGSVPHTNPPQNPGATAPSYAYPYYTTRGPRDFLMANPPSIGY